MVDKLLKLDTEQFGRIASLCTCANVRRAARAVTNLYDVFLQPSGLLATQFLLLVGLGAQPSITLTPLAERLGMDPTTLARNLKPLERDGLIQIVPGLDRRTRVLRLTDQGAERLAVARPYWEQAQACVIGQIGGDRWRTMLGDWSELATLTRI